MPAGRPKLYESDEALREVVDDYFASLVDEPPTVSGLALALDMTRETLNQYSKDEEFSDTIKKAKQRIEVYLEMRLYGSAPAGTIFNLKNNFGWKDESTTKHAGSINWGELDDEALDARIRSLAAQ